MPVTYTIFTAIIALIGSVSILFTAGVTPLYGFAGAGMFWGYYRTIKGFQQLSRRAIGGLSLGTFIVFLLDAVLQGDVFLAVAKMTLIFQAIKSFDMKDPWDPLQVFFVSLLQLLIASELTRSISFGIVFLIFLVFIVVSILLGHFVNEGQKRFMPFMRPIALVTGAVLIMTVLFFVSLPRLHGSFWGKNLSKSIRTAGFSDKVDFGAFGELKLDETVVMRMVVRPETAGSHYIRGMTFDFFDGSTWHDSLEKRERLYRSEEGFPVGNPGTGQRYEAEIFLEPLDSEAIFTLQKPYLLQSPGFVVSRDSAGSLSMRQKASKRFFYKIFSTNDSYTDRESLESYLQVSEGIGPVRSLAKEVTSGIKTAPEKAKAIQQYLLKNYRYSLKTDQPQGGTTVMEHFLFSSRRGYCEHFATAMVLMLRSVGLPARLVTGFSGSQKNDLRDYYILRQSDAHSWVEAFIDGRWILYDPTPPSFAAKKNILFLIIDLLRLNWDRYVVGFSSDDQKTMVWYITGSGKRHGKLSPEDWRGAAGVFALLMTTLLAFHFLKRKKSSERLGRVSVPYVQLRRKISASGGHITPSSTASDVLRESRGMKKFNQARVERFLEAYQRLRFSGQESEVLLRDFERLGKRLED